MATTYHAKHDRHLATWRIGSVDEAPEPPLDISEVVDLLYKAKGNARFREEILVFVTGIFEGEYPLHEELGKDALQTLSYLWHNQPSPRGALGRALELDRKYHPARV